MLLRLIGLWGIVESCLLVLDPRSWSRRWERWIRFVGERATLARVLALVDFAASLLLLAGSQRVTGRRGTAEHQPSASSAREGRGFIRVRLNPLLLVAFRLPISLYRLHLGWLLGHRFLLLTHRGRKSGRIRKTVLEVVSYDPETHESVVVSGWGERADWYRNIQANPALEVQTGRDRYVPTQRILSADEAYAVMVDYERRLPVLARPVVRRLGFTVSGSDEERRAHAAKLLMVGFRPRPA
jgi:deazaflavin-dependent oxidoreductase (nitroreductase family)